MNDAFTWIFANSFTEASGLLDIKAISTNSAATCMCAYPKQIHKYNPDWKGNTCKYVNRLEKMQKDTCFGLYPN